MENIAIILTSFITGALFSFIVCFFIHKLIMKNVIMDYNDEFTELHNEYQEAINGNNEEGIPEDVIEGIKQAISGASEEFFGKDNFRVVNLGKGVKKLNKYPFLELSTKKSFKKELSLILDDSVKSENFEKGAYIRDLIKVCDSWFDKRSDWFKSMVGSRIFLKKNECDCSRCVDLRKNGILLESEEEAMSFFGYENSYRIKGEVKRFYSK